MGLIKDIYSENFYSRLADSLQKTLPAFKKTEFMTTVLTPEFAQMEWKTRMQHTTKALRKFMPDDFSESVNTLENIIKQLKADGFGEGMLEFMFLPDYVAVYGIDDFEAGVKALEMVTQYVSAEFAIRPFILKYGNRMMDEILVWSKHKSYKVRRFASEGSRSRLPWALAIPALKKDPAPILPILENLKNDPHEWVRRSVANNLNDIAKDHPDVVINIAERWKGIGKATDAIIKHGCRTLLKSGHQQVLNYYGLNADQLELSAFVIKTPSVKIGDAVEFAFAIKNNDTLPRHIRLEYKLYYNKSNGQLAGKVFKLSERGFEPGEQAEIQRKQSFRLITTRKFYTGPHKLAMIVNGLEQEALKFELIT